MTELSSAVFWCSGWKITCLQIRRRMPVSNLIPSKSFCFFPWEWFFCLNCNFEAIKNKFAQVIVLTFKSEYPDHWPTFFQELFSLLQLGPVLIDMFLRIMDSIDRLIVNSEVIRSNGEMAQHTLIVHNSVLVRWHLTLLLLTWFMFYKSLPLRKTTCARIASTRSLRSGITFSSPIAQVLRCLQTCAYWIWSNTSVRDSFFILSP